MPRPTTLIIAVRYLAADRIRVCIDKRLSLQFKFLLRGGLRSNLQLLLSLLDVDIQSIQILNDVFCLPLPRATRPHATLIIVAVSALSR